MPSFCRHNRLVENCSICSKKPRVESVAGKATSETVKRERRPASGPRGSSKRQTAKGITVKRLTRAEDDGYDNQLLPGLRASEDARRLAAELVLSAARLDALAESAGPVSDPEAALSNLFQQAVTGSDDEASAPGSRGVPADDQPGLLDRYRAWAERHGGQYEALTAGASGAPSARFDRAYERLAISGLPRHIRFEFLLTAHLAGVLPDLDVWTLRLGDADAADPVLIAAKRVFGIGDPLLLQRRLRAACDAAGVPISAADLALWNWAALEPEQRVSVSAEPDAERLESATAAFGVPVS